MITQDQAAVIDLLASPSTHGGVSVERIETHTAMVFLAGTQADKLKRAVLFDYLGFSTPERRQRAQQTGMVGWHRLDATMPAEIVLQRALTCLHLP